MKRAEAREQAFILIFETIFNPDVPIDDMKLIAVEEGLFVLDDFAEELVYKTVENVQQLDVEIAKYLKNWTLSRISRVALAILRMAFAEISFFDDVPDKVAANEAVELAKKYGADKDPGFINGVLGSFIKAKNEE